MAENDRPWPPGPTWSRTPTNWPNSPAPRSRRAPPGRWSAEPVYSRIFVDKASGGNTGQSELGKALDYLREGDFSGGEIRMGLEQLASSIRPSMACTKA